MAKQSDHGRVIAEVAKDVLGPLGLKRKGRSRVYISDEGLWAGIVEFQPSGFSKGSYLNVAAHWLWHTHTHISFDFGDRVAGFESYRDPAQFMVHMRSFCLRAASEVVRLRALLGNLSGISAVLEGQLAASKANPWRLFDAAVVKGLQGRVAESRALFELLEAHDEPVEWLWNLKKEARELAMACADTEAFRSFIMDRVNRKRNAFGMSPDFVPDFEA